MTKSPRVHETTPQPAIVESDGGPARWLLPFLESRYLRLTEKPKLESTDADRHETTHLERERVAIESLTADRPGDILRPQNGDFQSLLQPGRDIGALVDLPPTYWHDLMRQYRDR